MMQFFNQENINHGKGWYGEMGERMPYVYITILKFNIYNMHLHLYIIFYINMIS